MVICYFFGGVKSFHIRSHGITLVALDKIVPESDSFPEYRITAVANLDS